MSGRRRSSNSNSNSGNRVRQCTSESEWRSYFTEIVESQSCAVVFFTASWCHPCRRMYNLYAEVSRNFQNVLFFKMDVDQVPDVAQGWAVEAMPTFVFLRDGIEAGRVVGAKRTEFMQALHELAA